MKAKQILGLIGSIILFFGVFTPIVSIPFMGNMNYFYHAKTDGIAILVMAVVSLVFVLMKKYAGLWFTGIISLITLIPTFIKFPLAQLQWGMPLLLIGVGFLFSCAVTDDLERYPKTRD